MLSILTWIPILGPIIEGVFGWLNKRQDNALEQFKAGRTSDLEESKVAANIIETTKDDIGIRLARDIIIFPVAVWTALIGWDTINALRFPGVMFHVDKYPESVTYLPYAVITFLLGNIGINAWKRR